MASEWSSTTSSRRGRASSADTRSQDGMIGNLLAEDIDRLESISVTSPESVDLPSPRGSRPAYSSGLFQRLVLAIDYGTTFTGVAFATPESDIAQIKRIEVVKDWGPGDMSNTAKIPSVYSYSPATNGELQWGYNFSKDAVTMINTKLELDVQRTKVDELELTLHVLEGTGNLSIDSVKQSGAYPAYTWKSPEEIVTDYLTKIFEARSLNVFKTHDILTQNMPVDIVITVPVSWSYRARNATFRAIKKAGFNEDTFPGLNDIILVSEPEAAALYIARHLKEDKRSEFLKVGECFILCDAGGGTVDCIAYQVVQLEPNLELKQVTMPTSDKCGSAYINSNFKRWLRDKLGEKYYRQLDPKSAGQRIGAHSAEGGTLRTLMGRFEQQKRLFSSKTTVVQLDLPDPLKKLSIAGRVDEGELTISQNEMKTLFMPCVNNVVQLIQGQVQQIERRQRRTKNVFLVGGFGESQYLQEELNKSLGFRKITLRKPDTENSWSAVAKGAVLYGIEKNRIKTNLKSMSASTKSYAIVIDEVFSGWQFDRRDREQNTLTDKPMAKKQLIWMVRKGDLIQSDEKKVEHKEFTFTFRAADSKKFDLPVYVYPDEDDDVPDRFETGQHEIEQRGNVKCDLSGFQLSEFDRRQNPKTREIYYIAYLVCKMQLSSTELEVEVYVNTNKVGGVQVQIGSEDMYG